MLQVIGIFFVYMLAVKLEDGQQLYKYRDRYYNNASWTSSHYRQSVDTQHSIGRTCIGTRVYLILRIHLVIIC